MASKRSQVRSNLQTITANQPVARVIDTYAPSAAPAPRKTDTTDILKTLINFGQSQGKRIAAQKKAEQEALEQQEKDNLRFTFINNPDEFVKGLVAGKFNNLTSVAQLYAGELSGEELGHTYGSALAEAWKSSTEFNTGVDAQGFEKFEDAFQTNWLKDNQTFFKNAGVTKGFSETLNGYLNNLRQEAISKTNQNKLDGYKASYESGVLSATQSVLMGNMTAAGFGKKIKTLQEDSKLAFGFDYKAMNTSTVKQLIKVAEAEGRSFSESKAILNLAYSVGTQGSNIGNIVENDLLLRASRAKIQEIEEARLKKVDDLAKLKRTETVFSAKAAISQKLESVSGEALIGLDIEEVFPTAEALAEARAEFPDLDIYFQKNKNFFVEGAEGGTPLPASEQLDMQMAIAQAESKEVALSLISTWQETRLKNNVPLFQKLFTYANSIKEAKAKNLQSFVKDPEFRFYFQRLNGTQSFGLEGVGALAFGSNPKLNEQQLKHISAFLDEFQSVYYGNYQSLDQGAKSKVVSDMFKRYKIKVDEAATKINTTTIEQGTD